jgi:transposase
MVDAVLRELFSEFARLYPKVGRPSIPPEKLLRALLLQVLYSICSERQLMEQLDYNLLYRWFVGLSMDDAIWNATVFTKNRERLLQGDVARAFFERVVAQAQARHLLSAEHFTVDGTLIEAWAGLKSFRRKAAPAAPPDDPGNPTVNFHGERRSNATHASTTDPEARLARKSRGQEAQLAYQAMS